MNDLSTASAEVLFTTASDTLLVPNGLDSEHLSRVFGQIMTHDVDYADLYFQYSRSEGSARGRVARPERRAEPL